MATGTSGARFRRHDAVFDWAARTDGDRVLVSGPTGQWTAGDPALDVALSESLVAAMRVQTEPEDDFGSHQDAGPVSLVGTASLAWCAEHLEVDTDPRRLRVNIVVETTEPFVEETWLGLELRSGDVVLRPTVRIDRCRTVNLAQDGVPTPTRLLQALGRGRNLCLGVYAEVVTPGTLRIDAEVTVPGPGSARP